MCTCSSVLKFLIKQLIFLLMIICEGKSNFLSNIDRNYCPFIETLSFGSDIDIKCNHTYLIFNEINNERLNWKFANQTSTCVQDGPQQGYVNQCDIRRLGSNYLKVPLKSLENNERACIYCRINYKSIAPLITAAQSHDGVNTLYTFNITATGLASNESFEILWAKRVHNSMRYSYNYWFLQKCIDHVVKILLNTPQTIIFSVDDYAIDRVEFLIRRCNSTCRRYSICQDEQFSKEIDSNSFQIPDSIEKISCDSNCLNSIITPTIPIITHRTRKVSSTSSTTTNTSLTSEQKFQLILVIIFIGLVLLIILLMILIYCVLCRSKGKKHVYAKTSPIDPDEHK